ncbi:ATP-binding cassette glutathione S-conjugate transporter ycf1 [Coemansia sp. RSA 1358]|nr:ATP-binding cassette glutathione S-conjugate transporter ycf1 [Coemansia sp. RSA 1358]
MRVYLVLINLDAQSQKQLSELKHRLLYTQERRLIEIQKRRNIVLDDLNQLPNRLRLKTVIGDFKYDTDESFFLLRAIFRMMWRPMIPLYILGSLANIIHIRSSILYNSFLHCIDFPSQHAWYDGYVAVLTNLICIILETQSRRVDSYVKSETKRVVDAIELELLRLPLTNTGLRKEYTINKATRGVRYIVEAIEMLQSTLATMVGIVATLLPIYNRIGRLAFIPLAVKSVQALLDCIITKLVGPSYLWNSGYKWYRYNGKVDEIYYNIKSIKMFGWERAFVDPELQKYWSDLENCEQRLWYAFIAKAAWFAFDLLTIVSYQLSTYLAIYSYTAIKSDSTTVISNADMFQLIGLISTLGANTNSLLKQVQSLRLLINKNYTIERALKGDFVNTLPRYPIKIEKDNTVADIETKGWPSRADDSGISITVEKCEFAWKKKPILKDITFSAAAGELVAVVGKTGSGKSSLLLSICGEVEMTQGSGSVFGSIALLEQSPWIMNGTVRINILFGREYDEEYYNKVLYACALVEDINAWKDGDQTVIGERGINISGGQRARLALARTIYSKADIYVLDDPLSAVDAHVKRHILDHVIMDSGLLAGKLRVVSIHDEHLLPFFSQIFRMDYGQVAVSKQSSQIYKPILPSVSASNGGFDFNDATSDVSSTVAADSTPSSPTTGKGASKNTESEDKKESKSRKWSNWDNTCYVLRICGLPTLATIALSGVFRPITSFIIDGYKLDLLRISSKSKDASNNDILRYLRTNMLYMVTRKLIMRIEHFIEEAIAEKHLETRIKSMFVTNLIHAPLSFFDSTTKQEISSAYNSGTGVISRQIPIFLMNQLSVILNATLSFYRVYQNLPQLLLIVPFFIWAGVKRTALFSPAIFAANKISYITDINKSRTANIIADGRGMIRLFNIGSFFIEMYTNSVDEVQRAARLVPMLNSFSSTIFSILNTLFVSLARLGILAQNQILGSNITSGELVTYIDLADMLVHYLEQITSIPNKASWFLDRINAFRSYITMDGECLFAEDAVKPPHNWPQSGKVEFRNFSMKYRSDLEYSLKDISLTIYPGEKIGVVGRTGAGKSSLTRALFRLIDSSTCSGSILIDDCNIFSLNIGDLRPRLGTIPQETTLFSGTFRKNLDPLVEFTIEDMWAALIKCNVAELVSPKRKHVKTKRAAGVNKGVSGYSYDEHQERMEERMAWEKQWENSGWYMRLFLLLFVNKPKLKDKRNHPIKRWCGLNQFIGGHGNFSKGQQQQFSLCRLLMRKRKILVLDEATADVDNATDQGMQKLIRSEFKDCTILTIAHRLETIMDSNRVIVMDKGRVAEVGPPKELINNNGLFAELVRANDFGK